MGTDISEGAKVGIILIILCALIAIVFSLLTMMKNITSSGSQSLQNGLDQLGDSEFQSYDQKTVSGTDVAAAIKIFEGRPVSFVVVTTADQKAATGGTYTGHLYGAYLTCTDPAAGVAGDDAGTNAGKYWQVSVNPANSDAEPGEVAAADGVQKYTGNSYYTAALYTNASGVVEYNMNTKPISVTGKKTYVRSSAKFMAELIKDPTGTKIGVVFTQQN